MSTETVNSLSTKSPRKELFEGLQIVGKAVATRSSLPILTHVLIRQDAETGKVLLTATDLEMWIEHTLPNAQSEMTLGVGGAATAPARNLAELLAAMPEADVEMTTEVIGKGGDDAPRALHLRCNRANYKLLGLSPEEFPHLPQVNQDTEFTIARGALHDAIKQVIFAVSTDEARPILTGILAVVKDNRLRLVATDTHRLAVRDIDIKSGGATDSQAVIPARAMAEVQRVLGSEEGGDVQVTLSTNQVKFEITDAKSGASTTLISRLIEGSFPSYERVIPQTHDRKLGIERDPLLAALRRAAIVAREGSSNRVVLRTGEGEGGASDIRLTIDAISGNLGNAHEEIEITSEGDAANIEIAFNAKYLIDVLNVLDGAGLHLELTESLRPGVVRPAEDGDYFCVLMPMQVV